MLHPRPSRQEVIESTKALAIFCLAMFTTANLILWPGLLTGQFALACIITIAFSLVLGVITLMLHSAYVRPTR